MHFLCGVSQLVVFSNLEVELQTSKDREAFTALHLAIYQHILYIFEAPYQPTILKASS
jgi:hypothetical protein